MVIFMFFKTQFHFKLKKMHLSYHMKKVNQKNKIGERGYKCIWEKKFHVFGQGIWKPL